LLKTLAKRLAHKAGLQVRRAQDPAIPFLRTISCDGQELRFWIANQHAKAWWDAPVLAMNAEFASLKQMCPLGSVVLDVGAHHGMDTVLLARWTGPSGHVYALEANPENALVLDANIAANRLGNCTGVHTAVGATLGTLKLADETVNEHSPLARTVPVTSLDAFCVSHAIERVALVKIDVEGYEGHVLRGATRLLAARPAIALELHLDTLGSYQSSPQDVLGQIDLTGYDAQMMLRPDWQTLHPFRGVSDLPATGTVNLFLRPR
jgi:FkbM family methyltransferase